MSVITELQKDVESLAKRMEHLEGKGVQDLEDNLRQDHRLKSLETREAELQILFERLNRLEKLDEEWQQAVHRQRHDILLLRDVVQAAAVIRRKINGQLQVLNAEHWLGPELRALDAAFKAVEEGWEGV